MVDRKTGGSDSVVVVVLLHVQELADAAAGAFENRPSEGRSRNTAAQGACHGKEDIGFEEEISML
jgi:hypothetical protein